VLDPALDHGPVAQGPQHQHAGEGRGTDPTISQRTRVKLTVPRRRCTPPPTGFMMTAATRSLETAASGWTLNTSTSSEVMSAPPPIPVRPTVNPTSNPAAATYGSIRKHSLHVDRQARTNSTGY
jgi:hypothetical protein